MSTDPAPPAADPRPRAAQRLPDRARLWLALLLILAFALRLWQLGELPFGFHPDEGHNALDAWRIWNGWRPVFVPGNNGREPLFFYLMALVQGLAGPTIWSVRLTAVVAGLLVIAAQATFTRGLPLPRPGRTALYAAALVAISFWPLAQSRYGLRAVLLPFWIALLLWAWWRAIRPPAETDVARGPAGLARWPWLWPAGLAGLFLAAAVYTHLTGRLLPAILVASALFGAWRWRSARPLAALALALGIAATLSLPLVAYFLSHPEMLAYRAGQVSAFNPEVNQGDLGDFLLANGWELVKMFTLEGDGSWYHNLRHRPVFDPLLGLFFLAGLALLARDLIGRRGATAQVAAFTLVIALAVTLVPSWLSVGAPNYVRLTGLWPVLFLLPAWGLERAATGLDAWGRRRASGLSPVGGRGDKPARLSAARAWLLPRSGGLAAALVIALGGLLAAGDYFRTYVPQPKVYEAFNGAAVERGLALRRLGAEGPLYVSPAIWRQSVIRYLNVDRPPPSFDPRFGLVLPPTGDARYAFDPVEAADAAAFGWHWPMARAEELAGANDATALHLYHLRRADWPAPPTPSGAVFGERLLLEAVALPEQVPEPGAELPLTLAWRTLAPTDVDMNLFVHLVAPDGTTVAQWDGPPLDGSYPTDKWQTGERLLLPLTIRLPAESGEIPLTVKVGWYDYRSGERLALPGSEDGALILGTLAGRRATAVPTP